MDQNRMPLVEALQQFREEAPAYFRIPGHRFERGLDEALNGASLAAYDLSEAEGLDDLHHAEGVIAEAQRLAAETWKAKKTFFLVNGTTCGNEAMVLSSVKEGEKIIVPRNVHKSVLMGLILCGATPVYVMPEYSTKWQMWGGVTPETIEKAFAETPDAKAVLLVSPTYYGLCSDLQAIAEICHCHNAALLVDEAHGSHLYFSEQLPLGALESGADACAQSIHKTAGSFTQSSFLSLGSGRLDEARVAANLQMVQSTSPSYLLMASLDAARRGMALHGKERMERALELGQKARQELAKIKGIEVLGTEMEGTCGVWKIDPTRLVFSARELGISGYDLQVRLYEEYRVSTELADEENVVCVITWANSEEDITRLIDALAGISAAESGKTTGRTKFTEKQWLFRSLPEMVKTPREAYFAEKEAVPFAEAEGRIAAEMAAPYPPGIPLICPGERYSREMLELMRQYKADGCEFHGPSDASLEVLYVLKEE